MANYFYQHFQIFSIYIYNENLPMKSYQFFKICKRFDKEREKTLMQQSMRKEKLRKVVCFIKSFNMIINHFFFVSQAHSQPKFLLFYIRMTQEILKGRVGNSKQLGMANYNVCFNNNFNRLVMNICLLKVNYNRSLQFVVVPTLKEH